MSERLKKAWVIAEFANGAPTSHTLEVVAFASKIAKSVEIVAIGEKADVLAGAVAVITGKNAIALRIIRIVGYNCDIWVGALKEAIASRRPTIVFLPHSSTGWDYAPALAVATDADLITAVSSVSIDQGYVFSRAICGGKYMEDVVADPERLAIITVSLGAAKFEDYSGPSGKVEVVEIEPVVSRVKSLGVEERRASSLDLEKAEVIVAAGRGIGGPEGLGPIRELASLFEKSAVGASRPLCDAGWTPLDAQVGMTGRTVSPKLYIACGISGAIQHTAGMSGSKCVVAINLDSGANIHAVADYSVIEDLRTFIPLLVENIKAIK